MSKLSIDDGTLAIIRETATQAAERAAERAMELHAAQCDLRPRVAKLELEQSQRSTWVTRAWNLIAGFIIGIGVAVIGKHWGK